MSPESRSVAASRVEMTEIVLPNDTNPLGNVMGGRILQWVDICAAVAAGRHARTPVVTASVDQVDFHRPVPVGGVVILLASVNFAGRTSMEVGVKVLCEARATGAREPIASAYLTFVSLDPDTCTPRPVPAIVPETADERRRFEAARKRRQERLHRRRS